MEEEIPVPHPGIMDRIPSFGAKTLAVFMLLAVVASAAVVNYLSTAAAVSANVQSPSKTYFVDVSTGTISEDGLNWQMGEIIGGSSYNGAFRLESLSNNPFVAQTQLNCKDDSGPTCDVEVLLNGEGRKCSDGKFILEEKVDMQPGYNTDYKLQVTPSIKYLGALGCQLQAFPVE